MNISRQYEVAGNRLCVFFAIALTCWIATDGPIEWPWHADTHAAEPAPSKDSVPKVGGESILGRQIDNFKLLRTDGTQFQLSEQKQKVLVVVFVGVECTC